MAETSKVSLSLGIFEFYIKHIELLKNLLITIPYNNITVYMNTPVKDKHLLYCYIKNYKNITREVFDFLLEKETDIDRTYEPNGATCLSYVLFKNLDPYFTKAILEKGANPNYIEFYKDMNHSMMDLATEHFNSENIKLLIQYGAKPSLESLNKYKLKRFQKPHGIYCICECKICGKNKCDCHDIDIYDYIKKCMNEVSKPESPKTPNNPFSEIEQFLENVSKIH